MDIKLEEEEARKTQHQPSQAKASSKVSICLIFVVLMSCCFRALLISINNHLEVVALYILHSRLMSSYWFHFPVRHNKSSVKLEELRLAVSQGMKYVEIDMKPKLIERTTFHGLCIAYIKRVRASIRLSAHCNWCGHASISAVRYYSPFIQVPIFL